MFSLSFIVFLLPLLCFQGFFIVSLYFYIFFFVRWNCFIFFFNSVFCVRVEFFSSLQRLVIYFFHDETLFSILIYRSLFLSLHEQCFSGNVDIN